MAWHNGLILTRKQFQIAMAIADDLPAKEIAQQFGIAVKTVEFHRKNLYVTLGVRGLAGVVRWLIRNGHLEA